MASNSSIPSLIDVPCCPLCAGTQWRDAGAPLPNLYSEKLAGLLGCHEGELLTTVRNRECLACGLYFKARWFPRESLMHLFQRDVPVHPKGWDVTGDRFTPAVFASDAREFGAALDAREPGSIARYRRRLESVVDSLIEIAGTPLAERLRAAIADGDVGALLSAGQQLAQLDWRPWPFKRFSGFSDASLWAWFETHLGPIARYGELGCPLWGFLYQRPATGVAWHYLHRAEANYWGPGCQTGGIGCLSRLSARGDLVERAWHEEFQPPLDLIGAFQYLDHVEQPLPLLMEALERARALALILDGGSAPTAVQHFTGWTLRSLQFAADRLGARLIHGFAPIRSSGNEVYLLQRAPADD